ncbi:hypothetical protein [uncultured Methanobrevibacter sp.]|nr:hypothetical protein [uncultured Methanobrevibacter sp.]
MKCLIKSAAVNVAAPTPERIYPPQTSNKLLSLPEIVLPKAE